MVGQQFGLNSPETTDRELRVQAGRYLVELRERHAAPKQTVGYVENTRDRRPAWRIGLGAGLLGVSAVLLGFGGRALCLNGACVDAPSGAHGQACGDCALDALSDRGVDQPARGLDVLSASRPASVGERRLTT